MDLICGEYGKKMYIYYGDGNGGISGGGAITDADGSQDFGYDRFNGPALVDVDNDGLKDLLVANSNNGQYPNGMDGPGPLRYYRNVGDIGAPLFKFIENLKDTAGQEIAHVYHRVQVADMDNDGLFDLVTSNSVDKNSEDTTSFIMFYRNCGSLGSPEFEPGVKVTHTDGTSIPVNYAIRIGVSDVNNDGVNDIILNTSHHYPGRAGVLLGHLNGIGTKDVVYGVQKEFMSITFTDNKIVLERPAPVSILSPAGRVVYKSNESVETLNLNEMSIAPGVHMIKIKSQKGEVTRRFIMK